MQLDFKTLPCLNTEYLILRKISQADSEGLYNLRTDENVVRYTGLKIYGNIEEAKEYIRRRIRDMQEGDCAMWSIYLKERNAYIGGICLWNFDEKKNSAEIGYELLPAFHGKGLMTQALKSVIAYGFGSLCLSALTADLRSENSASVKLLERFGFVRGRAT